MADAEHDKKDASAQPGHEKDGGHEGGGHGGGGHGGGGGHEEAHEGAPEWLISFADLVALMMGFFVILFALNITPKDRRAMGGTTQDQSQGDGVGAPMSMIDFAIGVREAFNNPVNLGSSDPADQPLIRRILERRGKSRTTTPGVEGNDHDVQSIRPSDFYAVSGGILFAEDSTELTAAGKTVVDEVVRKVRGVMLIIEVRGHASAGEAAGNEGRAMRLSADRAFVVATELAAQGVSWWQIRLTACGDHDRVNAFPSAPTDDNANARVEVVISNEVVPTKVPTAPGNARRGS